MCDDDAFAACVCGPHKSLNFFYSYKNDNFSTLDFPLLISISDNVWKLIVN